MYKVQNSIIIKFLEYKQIINQIQKKMSVRPYKRMSTIQSLVKISTYMVLYNDIYAGLNPRLLSN